jgi:GNAT superfamily N-acetyltransferase
VPTDWKIELDGDLLLQATTRADSPLVDVFFAEYERAFTLPDEREEIDGFRECLALNGRQTLFPDCDCLELVMLITTHHGTVLGGANFLAIPACGFQGLPPVSVALNYVFVNPAARGRGLLRQLLSATATLVETAMPDKLRGRLPALFIELNDPLQLSDADYRVDSEHSGLDQFDRLRIWDRVGAKLVDFPYVQPALSAGKNVEDNLALGVINIAADRIDAAYLHNQLEKFFGISVLKGRDPMTEPHAAAQLIRLTSSDEISLFPMTQAIDCAAEMKAKGEANSIRKVAQVLYDLRMENGANSG